VEISYILNMRHGNELGSSWLLCQKRILVADVRKFWAETIGSWKVVGRRRWICDL